LWSEKSGRSEYLNYSADRILHVLGLANDHGIKKAGIILFGKKPKIDEFFPGSEIILEWRSNPYSINYDFRQEWREPFFKIIEEIWKNINSRNSKVSMQEGLTQKDIYIFSEKPIRKAVLNAVTHRDYSIVSDSIFIKFSPRSFVITSPGGFMPGINPDNILNKQSWRNRRIAETFQRAGLVERAGQGVDDIFKFTIQEGKGIPDFSRSDNYEVVLKIPAKINDMEFVRFLSSVTRKDGIKLDFDDIYELENVRENKKIRNIKTAERLLNLGIIEIIPSKKNEYILCRKYYTAMDKKGEYTRIKGLTRQEHKALLLKHIANHNKGCMKEFIDALPRNLKKQDISSMLHELAKENKIEFTGSRRKSGYWKITKKVKYRRIKGADREKYKMLLFKYIDNKSKGCMKEFAGILPGDLKKQDISAMLHELAKANLIRFTGSSKNGFWEIKNTHNRLNKNS
jgi:ATP-dependent DNA helicase RecG